MSQINMLFEMRDKIKGAGKGILSKNAILSFLSLLFVSAIPIIIQVVLDNLLVK